MTIDISMCLNGLQIFAFCNSSNFFRKKYEKNVYCVLFKKDEKGKICRTMFEYDVYYSNVMYNNAQI